METNEQLIKRYDSITKYQLERAESFTEENYPNLNSYNLMFLRLEAFDCAMHFMLAKGELLKQEKNVYES